jgi:hypothetical protein
MGGGICDVADDDASSAADMAYIPQFGDVGPKVHF